MLNISKGIVLRPQKVVVYGPEGIGKSTFASHFPDPLFLDIEDSTSQLDVKRIPDINSWAMLMGIIEEVTKEKPCKTLVIDTVDWAEKLCIQYVCAQAKKSSIEDFAYGSGYTKLMEAFARFLEALNGVTKAGINVVLNAHAQIRKFEQPDEMGAYDRWELKLNSKTTNKTAAIVKEWADALLFANYKTIIMTDQTTNKKKGVGGKRVMHTQHASTWDAKNRWCLPPEVPFEYAALRLISLTLESRLCSLIRPKAVFRCRQILRLKMKHSGISRTILLQHPKTLCNPKLLPPLPRSMRWIRSKLSSNRSLTF